MAIDDFPDAWAAWSRDPLTREYSTSGGLFSEFAREILEAGGQVSGVAWTDDYRDAERRTICTMEELPPLQQSKYFQSRLDLSQAQPISTRPFLFTGTPCQVALFFDRYPVIHEFPDTLTIELICRGVNQPWVYRAWLNVLEHLYGSTVSRVWFKNKERGWKALTTRVDFKEGGVYYGDRNTDWFMRGYLHPQGPLFLVSGCHRCVFRMRQADITLGDFWRAPKYVDDDCGISAVLLNTRRGVEWFKRIQDRLTCRPVERELIEAGNPHLRCSAPVNPRAQEFQAALRDNHPETQAQVFAQYCRGYQVEDIGPGRRSSYAGDPEQ